MKNKIIDFAKLEGFDTAQRVENWRGYEIYEPLYNDGEVHYIGLPFFIMLKDDEMRMSTLEETLAWIDEQ